MKKIMFALLAVFVAFGASAMGQGSWVVGVGGDAAVPIGDFADVSKVGFGGAGWVGYVVDPNLTVTGKVGVLSFSGKDFTTTIDILGTPTTVTASGGSSTVIPILVGVRYFFMPPADMRVYGAAEAGMFNINNGVGTKFGFAPALGAQFKSGDNMNVDVHANFSYISTDVKSTTWVGVGIGLEFDLK